MISWLKKLFRSCDHEWETIQERGIYRGQYAVGKAPMGILFVLRCKKCGWVREKRVMP